jgi:hypothetical protein
MVDALTWWPSFEQLALDPLVSPGVVLGGEPFDQRDDIGADQAAVPPPDGVGRDQPAHPQPSGSSRIPAGAAAPALAGAGSARIGADLGVPAATVRGWLRLRSRAERMRCYADGRDGVPDRRHRPGPAPPGGLAAG